MFACVVSCACLVHGGLVIVTVTCVCVCVCVCVRTRVQCM